MLWKFEEREKSLSFNEPLSGPRFHAVPLSINKSRYDISLFSIDAFIYWLLHYIRKLKEIYNILAINRIWRTRLYEIGIIIKDFCLYFGLTGILSRAIKIIIDARYTGYEFYEELNYAIFYSAIGDSLDRYILRFNEIIESCRIIYALLYIILSLLYLSMQPSAIYRSIVMEWLIEEFLINFPLILSLISRFKLSIESSKGIYSIYLFSLVIILPFLIKIPTFPFYYWLPEVHCEANTSISLFLAGLLLKLSIFGIIKSILCTFYLSLRFLSSILIYIILIGIVIINSSYFRYYDLKKIIALSSILHLNLTFQSMLSLNSEGNN